MYLVSDEIHVALKLSMDNFRLDCAGVGLADKMENPKVGYDHSPVGCEVAGERGH